MLKVFFGSDAIQVRTAAQAAVQAALKAGAVLTRIDSDQYEPGQVRDLVQANSLFGEQQVVVIDTPSSNEQFQAESFEVLAPMSESNHTFVLIEDSLTAPIKKKFEKAGAEATEFSAVKAERYNAFALADALTLRDKKNLWLLLQEAKQHNLPAEEIIGVLYWQVKIIRLTLVTNTPEEAGQKPYPYSKAKRALQKYTPEEIHQLSRDLLTIYHEGHAGISDIDNALEAWVLGL